jgi:hypothetical protein
MAHDCRLVLPPLRSAAKSITFSLRRTPLCSGWVLPLVTLPTTCWAECPSRFLRWRTNSLVACAAAIMIITATTLFACLRSNLRTVSRKRRNTFEAVPPDKRFVASLMDDPRDDPFAPCVADSTVALAPDVLRSTGEAKNSRIAQRTASIGNNAELFTRLLVGVRSSLK